jgi:hypothetical protein
MEHEPPVQSWTQSPEVAHCVEQEVESTQLCLQSPPAQSTPQLVPAAQA